MPPLAAQQSPPLTRSRTAEYLEQLGGAEGGSAITRDLFLEGVDETLTTARPRSTAVPAVYEPAAMPRLGTEGAAAAAVDADPVVSVCMDNRRRFRRLDDKPALGGEALGPLTPLDAGLFDIIDDEALLLIMHNLVTLPDAVERGLELGNAVKRGARWLRSLLLSCKRMAWTLRSPGHGLHREMAARAATQIEPCLGGIYPFTSQMRRESRSSDQLEVLRQAIMAMAVHCAGSCCLKAQNSFNRVVRSERRLHVVATRSTITAAAPAGDVAFIAVRRRRDGFRVKQREHNRSASSDARMTSEWITRVAHDRKEPLQEIELPDLSQFSPPHTMRSCQLGRSVAMIRNVYASHADERIPHSVVMVWDTEAPERLSDVVEPPAEADNLGAINAQDAWWLNDSEDPSRKQLVVLWSTAYVHPMGTVVGANADNAAYFIAIYAADLSDVQVYIGPFHGKAQTASPSAAGDEVAVLIRKRPVGAGPGSFATATRCTMMHRVFCEHATELTHTTAIGQPRGSVPLPVHPYDLNSCPSAVALSPSGDCVVAVHRRYLSIFVEILLCTAPGVFVSVQTIDVTHWTTLGSGEPSIFDSPEFADAANNLKLPYKITFSPCGRFAAIVDQRPLFGLSISNYAVVVLDMSLRHERRGVRALPLAPVEDVAPRSLEWTERGLWLQPRYGCLFLKSAVA